MWWPFSITNSKEIKALTEEYEDCEKMLKESDRAIENFIEDKTDLEKLKAVFDDIGVEYKGYMEYGERSKILLRITGDASKDIALWFSFKDGKFTHID